MDHLDRWKGTLVKGCMLAVVAWVLVTTAACGGNQLEVAPDRPGWPTRLEGSAQHGAQTVLTVTGLVNDGDDVNLDLDTIIGLPATTFTGVDLWSDSKIEFTGMILSELLTALEVDSEASSIVVHAVNDYEVAIDLADVAKYEYLLCYQEDELLYSDHAAERDRGPLSIAIDFGRFARLDVEMAKYDLVWRVDEIRIR